WSGKTLKVDLTESSITELNTMDYADRFLGGRGAATRIYWELAPPDAAAFDPENPLILMNGPFSATGVPGASRFEVVSKSPMLNPERFSYGNMGGTFGPYLKRAGYDGVVIKGRADRPSYIYINDGRAEILDGAWLWGKGVREVSNLLREKHGKQVRFVTTGPAGENRCRTATLNTDNEGSVTGGHGAVMGSKNLKAIAVTGTGHPKVVHPEKLKELIRQTMEISKRGTLRMPYPKQYVTYKGKSSCYQCALDCLRGKYVTNSGLTAVSKCGPLTFYVSEAMSRREDNKIDAAFEATEMCNDFSLCTSEMKSILGWLNECYEEGFLSEQDTGLDLTEIGSHAFIEKMLSMIARREGFGDILAEGMARIGEKLGEKALSFFPLTTPAIQAGTGYAPQMYYTNAMLYATEPRTPIAALHEVGYMIARWLLHQFRPDLSPTTAKVFREATKKFWHHEKAWDLTSYEGKAEACVTIQNRTHVKDSLPLCDCAWPLVDSFNTPDNIGDPALESKLFSAVTGIETDEMGLLRYGERILNLQRAILLREGRKAIEDDEVAEFNYTVPLEKGGVNPRLIVPGPTEEPVSIRGNLLDREKFKEMRHTYYTIRGWDPETGLQKTKTLERLGMADIIPDLEKRGQVK
ncbi:aldehyde ferredoxin oxidoreductase N-terminal domain-containing protein, partial [Thermodesulfobacteriota bacterium]